MPGGRPRRSTPDKPRTLSTVYMEVPVDDWPRVKAGEKTEFRTTENSADSSALHGAVLPTPVVAYAKHPVTERVDARLMVLLERRVEPIFAISRSPASVAREGFESYDHFRRYWRKRQGGKYDPMQRVWVWWFRPWSHVDDVAMFGAVFIEFLYGDYFGDKRPA